MPIYEYRCGQCGHEFEMLIRSQGEAKRLTCPQCQGGKIEQKLSVFAAPPSQTSSGNRPPGCQQCCQPGGSCPMEQ